MYVLVIVPFVTVGADLCVHPMTYALEAIFCGGNTLRPYKHSATTAKIHLHLGIKFLTPH